MAEAVVDGVAYAPALVEPALVEPALVEPALVAWVPEAFDVFVRRQGQALTRTAFYRLSRTPVGVVFMQSVWRAPFAGTHIAAREIPTGVRGVQSSAGCGADSLGRIS